MYKQKEIENLVAKLYFLPWEETQSILKRAASAPSEVIDKLIAVLKDALEKQNAMMKKMIEADPEFPKKLDEFATKEVHDAATKIEASDQAKAAEKFSDFE
jgi:CRISPR/Cas system-associated protein Cas10 (large subunit of type III CRISPR-Cas system)